jgi:hypothetical protein
MTAMICVMGKETIRSAGRSKLQVERRPGVGLESGLLGVTFTTCVTE